MSPEQWFAILPFWILGVPFVVGLIGYLKPDLGGDYVPPDRRNRRSNLIGDPVIRAGDSVLFEG